MFGFFSLYVIPYMLAQYRYLRDSELVHLVVIKKPHNPFDFRSQKFLSKPHFNKETKTTQNVLVAYTSAYNAKAESMQVTKGSMMSCVGVQSMELIHAKDIALALNMSLFVVLNMYCPINQEQEKGEASVIHHAYFWLARETKSSTIL